MSSYYSMEEMNDRTNKSVLGSTLTTVNIRRHTYSAKSRAFDLTHHDKEQALITYMHTLPLPDLIIKLVGINHEQSFIPTAASVQNAFTLSLRTLMEQTRIWLINGTLAMLNLPECDIEIVTNDQQIPDVVVCEPFSKSLLFEHHPTATQSMNKILSHIQEELTTSIDSYVPMITLVVQGDSSSAVDIVENVSKNIPVLILKGTGPIANQLAAAFETRKHQNMIMSRALVKNESRHPQLSDVDLRRLTHMNDTEQSLVFVCQPGKDDLGESILRAIGVVTRLLGKSNMLIDELHFAMRWNKIDFARLHLLNYNTVIEWTNDELDQCLETAMRLNTVPFVELLFDYGASLQRLALVGNHDNFRRKSEVKESQLSELIIQTIPIVAHVDAATRAGAYLLLLFHSAVENRNFELAISICARLEDFITALLLVSLWCQYSQSNDSITSAELRNYRQQFEKYAADVLDLYYADNEKKAVAFLNQKSILYRDQQAIVLIDDLCSKCLTSTKCMQSYTNAVWYGDYFQPNKDGFWEMMICLVCLCPLLLLIPWVQKRILLPYNVDEEKSDRKGFWQKFTSKLEPFRRFFYGNTVIPFHYNIVSFTAFLLLFSYTLLFDYYPLNIYNENRSNIYRLPIPLTEVFLHIFLASIAFEEIKQVFFHAKSVRVKTHYWKNVPNITSRISGVWSYYHNDNWNILDFIAFSLWIVGFFTRFIVTRPAFEVSKICMSLDLCLWYIRCLHVFLASERLGPKLLMIFHTMKDLVSFLFFILAFLFAYATSTYALISTSSFVNWSNSTHFSTIQNGKDLTRTEIVRNIIEWGTWKIFGSMTMETFDKKFSPKNDSYGFVTLFLTIAFLIVAYVLLLNNLIALFNFTIQRVHAESRRAWFYYFYVLVREYREKDMFVPPFNLILWPLSYYLRKKLDKTNDSNSKAIDTRDEQQTRRHQQHIAEQYWKAQRASKDLSANIQSYVCRQCQCRGTEADYIESTTFF